MGIEFDNNTKHAAASTPGPHSEQSSSLAGWDSFDVVPASASNQCLDRQPSPENGQTASPQNSVPKASADEQRASAGSIYLDHIFLSGTDRRDALMYLGLTPHEAFALCDMNGSPRDLAAIFNTLKEGMPEVRDTSYITDFMNMVRPQLRDIYCAKSVLEVYEQLKDDLKMSAGSSADEVEVLLLLCAGIHYDSDGGSRAQAYEHNVEVFSNYQRAGLDERSAAYLANFWGDPRRIYRLSYLDTADHMAYIKRELGSQITHSDPYAASSILLGCLKGGVSVEQGLKQYRTERSEHAID